MAGVQYPSDQWERLWFALADRPWRSLAIVAAQPGLATVDAANGLRDAAMKFQESSGVLVIDASMAEAADVPSVQNLIADGLWSGQRVIAALGDPLQHSPTIPLARFMDAALLCVVLTRASATNARQVVRTIGASRFLGSVTMDPG